MMNYMTSNTRIPPYMVFPRFLLDLRLNGTARLLYTILLDRARLSQGNAKFTDEKGQVYVIFPIESLAAAINKSEMTVKNALSDLEKQGLIKRKHQPHRKISFLLMDKILSPSQTENCPEIKITK